MKTTSRIIGRTLILLTAALLVVGITLILTRNAGSVQSFSGPEGASPNFDRSSFENRGARPGMQGVPEEGFQGSEGEEFGRRGSGSENREGGFMSFESVKNLLVIAVIVLVYAGISRVIAGLRSRQNP